MTTTTQKTVTCANCQHFKSETWGDGWIDERTTEESCLKHQWEYEEPSPSPASSCELFEVAIADPEPQIDFEVRMFDDCNEF